MPLEKLDSSFKVVCELQVPAVYKVVITLVVILCVFASVTINKWEKENGMPGILQVLGCLLLLELHLLFLLH